MAVTTVRYPSKAGLVGSGLVGVFNTSEIGTECPTKTAISNDSTQLFHSFVGDSSICQHPANNMIVLEEEKELRRQNH